MRDRCKLLILLICIYGIATGCNGGAVKIYEGDDLPKERTSLIHGSWPSKKFPPKIDDIQLPSQDSVYMLPGKHVVEFTWGGTFIMSAHNMSQMFDSESCKTVFKSEAGKAYRITQSGLWPKNLPECSKYKTTIINGVLKSTCLEKRYDYFAVGDIRDESTEEVICRCTIESGK